MKAFFSILIAACGITGSWHLLKEELINQGVFLGCLTITAFSAIALLCLDRLKEFDMKNLKFTLNEIKQAQQKLETTKSEIIEMYGGIEKLRNATLNMDDIKVEELGGGPGPVFCGSVMRYVSGVVTRERERQAKIFVNHKEPDALARAILDTSLDDNVFKWIGPGATLDEPPMSVEERKQKKEKSKE